MAANGYTNEHGLKVSNCDWNELETSRMRFAESPANVRAVELIAGTR